MFLISSFFNLRVLFQEISLIVKEDLTSAIVLIHLRFLGVLMVWWVIIIINFC